MLVVEYRLVVLGTGVWIIGYSITPFPQKKIYEKLHNLDISTL